MLARNCDLCWLASSSWRLFSWISRKSRALSTAMADCVAKVSSSRTTLAGNSPGPRRLTTSAPTTWSARTIGTASSARKPALRSIARVASDIGLVSKSDTCAARRVEAARQTTLSRASPMTWRNTASVSSSSPQLARGTNSSCVDSTVYIVPESTPASRTEAWTTVSSTVSSSSEELTA